jgi:hypothetical protein
MKRGMICKEETSDFLCSSYVAMAISERYVRGTGDEITAKIMLK